MRTREPSSVPPSDALTLAGGRIVTPDGVLHHGWVRVRAGRIEAVGTGDATGETVDLGGAWLVPGFVDIHCHGGGGGAFGTEPGAALTAIDTHLRHGTTTMLASLVSAPVPQLTEQIRALAGLVAHGRLAGIHLEGPFLSAARCGAHDPQVLVTPDTAVVRQLLDAGGGTVRMVTIAPELPGALPAIRQLVDSGVVAAIGHTDATLDQVIPAVHAGATVATHLFNGMRGLHHREPGPIGALLGDERVAIELICDLVHLHPAVVRLAAAHAGRDRTVLVTDAISATETGDGQYRLGELTVTVSGGEPRLPDGSLAGSTLTMDVALRNLITRCGRGVTDAVAATSTNPARLLGLADRLGAIRPGLAADLVVLDDDFRGHAVMRHGEWIVQPH